MGEAQDAPGRKPMMAFMGKDDDWETPPEAFTFLAECLRRDHPAFDEAHRRFYDPYYCRGMARTCIAKAFGVPEDSVLHEAKDFYNEKTRPDRDAYDMIVTNPPYSDMKKALSVLRAMGKPFAMCVTGASLFAQYSIENLHDKLDSLRVYAPFRRWKFYKDGTQWHKTAQCHVWVVVGLPRTDLPTLYYEPPPPPEKRVRPGPKPKEKPVKAKWRTKGTVPRQKRKCGTRKAEVDDG